VLYSLPWREGVRGRGTGPPPTSTLMFERRLVVEVDGGHHGEEAIARRDEERTTWLKEEGLPGGAVAGQRHPGDFEGVLESIAEGLCGDSGTPSPYPSPVKGEGMVNRGTNSEGVCSRSFVKCLMNRDGHAMTYCTVVIRVAHQAQAMRCRLRRRICGSFETLW